MAKGSAFARMIGLTKSFSPLSFDRSPQGEGDAGEPAAPTSADTVDDTAAGSSPVTIAADSDAFPVAPGAPAPAQPATAPAADLEGVVLSFPAVSKVTVVAEEKSEAAAAAPAARAGAVASDPLAALALPAAAGLPSGHADADAAHDLVTAEAISAIEADIASLLASLDREDLASDESLPIDLLDAEGDDAQVGALLSELDRLWQADRAISASRGA